MKFSLLAWLVLGLVACGGAPTVTELPPPTAVTVGESLFSLAPLGADLMVEVDLRRLRDNPVVGSVLSTMAPPPSPTSYDLLQLADAALLCVYDIGGAAKQLVILRSSQELGGGAVLLGKGLYAVGDADLVKRSEGIQSAAQTMAADTGLLRLRAGVMPEKAESASLRLAARLDFDARVAIAAKVAVSDVPVSIAVWADVVDDLALVANLATEDEGDAPRLERAIVGLRHILAKGRLVRYLGLAKPVRDARVTRSSEGVQVVFLSLIHISEPTRLC